MRDAAPSPASSYHIKHRLLHVNKRTVFIYNTRFPQEIRENNYFNLNGAELTNTCIFIQQTSAYLLQQPDATTRPI